MIDISELKKGNTYDIHNYMTGCNYMTDYLNSEEKSAEMPNIE